MHHSEHPKNDADARQEQSATSPMSPRSEPPGTRFETQLIHAGEMRPRVAGAVSMPIFQSSTFEFGGESNYHDVRYIRLNNTPNHVVLHAKLAALEHGEAALVTGSGMAAISGVLLANLSAGDHIIAQKCLYGGSQAFITQDLPRFGISHSLVDAGSPKTWHHALTPKTKVIYVESMTNPLLEVGDLSEIVRFAGEHQLVSIIDNTLPSPLNFCPLALGFDLSVHSATKYLNGHTDIVAGAVIGSQVHVDRVKHMIDHLGGTLDPHACFLLGRGIKTLAVRMRHQNDSALAIARFLESHAKVKRVYYAGLESHPDYSRARQLFVGFGGLLSFEIGGDEAVADRLMGALELPACAPSLGGVESLVTRPATTSHAGLGLAGRRAAGIAESLIRLSVGLENTDDLIEDLDRALARVA